MLEIPEDDAARQAVKPVICYPVESLPKPNIAALKTFRQLDVKSDEVIVAPRDASCFNALAGSFFRIFSIEGAQVGDLNLWNDQNLHERFCSGKTRALHLTQEERMWSCFPCLRPMATVFEDTLAWYGIDAYKDSVYAVIGTRCDPYTHGLLSGGEATPMLSFQLNLGFG